MGRYFKVRVYRGCQPVLDRSFWSVHVPQEALARYRFAHPFHLSRSGFSAEKEPCLPTTSSAPSSTGDSKSTTTWKRARRWNRSIRSSTSIRSFMNFPGRKSNSTKPLLISEYFFIFHESTFLLFAIGFGASIGRIINSKVKCEWIWK